MTKSWMFAGVLAACAAQTVEYRDPVAVSSAQLVRIDPDVQVVADADKPMFFAAGRYWMFHDGGWYRAASVRGPWLRDRHPAWQIRKIDQPYAFVHYNRSRHDQTATSEQIAPAPQQDRSKRGQMFGF